MAIRAASGELVSPKAAAMVGRTGSYAAGAAVDRAYASEGLGTFVGKRVTARGFIVTDFAAHYGPALKQMGAWVTSGRLKYREDIVEGIDKAPRAFIGLLRGENFGKLLVRLGPEPGGR